MSIVLRRKVVIPIHKKIVIPALIVAITAATVLGIPKVNAQTPTNPITSLVQKIAQRFGLKETDVQAVFDEQRQDHINQMQVRYESKLDQAVSDGKLTEAQKQLVLAKHKELATQRQTDLQDWKTMTPEQRKTVMQKQKQDLEDWAKQNTIDLHYLLGFGGKGMGMGRMHLGWRGK